MLVHGLVGFGPSTISSWDQGAMVELSPCSKGGQGEGEAAVIAPQPASQGIEPGTTESVDQEESPEPPAPNLAHRKRDRICFYIWFGLVRIRPLRSDLTISEPWDEGDGFEWAKVDVARVVESGFLRLPPPREWPSSQVDHHCRETARVTVTCPVDDVH